MPTHIRNDDGSYSEAGDQGSVEVHPTHPRCPVCSVPLCWNPVARDGSVSSCVDHIQHEGGCRTSIESLHPNRSPSGFPHNDGLCAQNSVDADCFTRACRQITRLADALGLTDTGHSITEVIDAALDRLTSQTPPMPEWCTTCNNEAFVPYDDVPDDGGGQPCPDCTRRGPR